MLDPVTAWQRVIPFRPSDVIAGCCGVIAVAGIVFVLVSASDGIGDGVLLEMVVVFGFFALIATSSWRLGRMGVYVSDRGVRVQYFVGSDVVEWPDVRRFVVRPSHLGFIGMILGTASEEIWVVRRNGDPIQTQVAHLTEVPQLVRLSAQHFAAVTRMRDEDFEQAFGRLEDARIRYTGRGSV